MATTNLDALSLSGALAVTGAITATGGVTGDITGDITGDVEGDLTGDVTGDVTGNITSVVGSENIGVPSVVSVDIAYDTTAGTVATIGDGEIWFVHSVLVNVTADFDASGDDAALTVGDDGDTDGFIVLADAELQAADTEATGFAAGWQGMAAATLGAYLDGNHNSFVYAPSGAAQTIDYAIAGTALSAGEATIYVQYTRIS